jgi:hypothetical protein
MEENEELLAYHKITGPSGDGGWSKMVKEDLLPCTYSFHVCKAREQDEWVCEIKYATYWTPLHKENKFYQ